MKVRFVSKDEIREMLVGNCTDEFQMEAFEELDQRQLDDILEELNWNKEVSSINIINKLFEEL